MNEYIVYDHPYKYQTFYTFSVQTDIKGIYAHTAQLHLAEDGVLTITKGYKYDGPSGPAVDTDNFMDGSAVHDALYELGRRKLLPIKFRKNADRMMFKINRAAGMSRRRAAWTYAGVRAGARKSFTRHQHNFPRHRKIPSNPLVIVVH